LIRLDTLSPAPGSRKAEESRRVTEAEKEVFPDVVVKDKKAAPDLE